MQSKRIRVLVIEDNLSYANLLQDMLENRDEPSFDVVCASRLSDGLERLAASEFDVALIDLQLPESQGLKTFHSVYAQAPDLPIIVLSGLDDEGIAVKAVRTGAQDYLVKDEVTGGLLPRAIRYAIERKQAAVRVRESEERFRGIYEHSPIGIAIYDADRHLVRANQACLDIFGVSDAEAIESVDLLSARHLPQEPLKRLQPDQTVRYERSFDVDELEALGLSPPEGSWPLYLDVLITALARGEAGTSGSYLVQLQDTTKRREAEKELESSRNYYRAVLNSLHDQVLVVDDDYRITDINQIFLQQLGCSREEVVGRFCFEAVHGADEPCDEARRRCPTRRVWETGHAQRAVHMYEQEGVLRWFDLVASPLHENGQVIGVVEAYREVTAERRLEERLAGVNALGRELMLTRDERQITQIAVDAARILSQSPVCGLWLLDEERGELVRWAHSHGAHAIAQETIALEDDLEGAPHASLISDAIQSGEAMYIHSFEASPREPIGEVSESGLTIPLQVKGRVIGALAVENPQSDAFDTEDEQLLSTLAAQAAVAIENARLHEKAEQEIAERRRAEKAAERHATRLALLNEVSSRIAATLQLDQLFDKAADLVHDYFGYHHVAVCIVDEEEEAVMMVSKAGEYAQAFSPDHRVKMDQGIVGWVARRGKTLLVNDVEEDPRYVNLYPNTVLTRSELSIPIQVGDTILGVIDIQSPQKDAFDEDDLLVMETLADQIAVAVENARLYEAEKEQRKLVERSQAQLVQSEKLAATGRLTASLAHEINNPLQAIHNSLQIMLSFDLDPEEQRENLEMADEDVKRLINMVGRMLDFARRPELEKKLTDVNHVVEKTLRLSSKYLQHSDVTLQKELMPDLPLVLGTPGELQQVFLNLTLNAIDAMPGGGELRVRSYINGDGYVAVSFSDTGRGIPPEYRGRIFEPFFSTKEEGTGLGLSVSYSVVRSHRGEIDVESEVGEGTTFTIRLPILSR